MYSIVADVSEKEKSSYKLAMIDNPAIVSVSPEQQFSRFVRGVFKIKALEVGQTNVAMTWTYDPNNAGATCIVSVNVVATEEEAALGRAVSTLFSFSGSAADPISTYTGDFYMHSAPDLALGGPMPLFFQRYYNSGLSRQGFVTQQMGRNWTHNYDLYLYPFGDEVFIVHRDGKVLQFQLNGESWDLVSPLSQPYQLLEDQGEYVLMDPTDQRRYFFNSDGNLTAIKDRNDNTHTMTVANENLIEISDGLGRRLSLTYGGLNKVASVSDGTRTVTFTNFFLDLEEVRDARGHTTDYHYPSSDGRLGSITRPEGNTPLSRTFTGDQATRETDADNNQTLIDYNGLQTEIIDPLSDIRKHIHSDNGELLQSIDPLNRATTLGYNADTQRNSITDREGNETSWSIHEASGRIESYTDAEGQTTEYTYTAQQQHGFTFYDITEIHYSDNTMTTITVDASGNPLTVTNPDNETWAFTYNSRGQVITETNPTNGVTTYGYDANGDLETIRNHFNDLTSYDYDGFSRVTRVDYPGGDHREMTYDDNDNLLTVTDERNQTWTYTYDDNNNLVTATDPRGETLTNVYDDMDRISRIVDREANQIDFTYDERGRMKTLVNGAGETTTYGYDVNDRQVTTADNGNRTVTTERNSEGEVTSVTDPLNNVWSIETDAVGRVVKQTNPRGGESTFEYDGRGRLLRSYNEVGTSVERTYDSVGRISSMTVDTGSQVTYGRNALGIINEITDPNQGVWTRGFDPSGRMTSETDPLGRSANFTYDNRSRIEEMATELGNLTFSYDAAGNLTSRAYSDGKLITYGYDDNSRLVSATNLALGYDGERNIIDCNGMTMTYDGASRLETIQYAPGKIVTYTYDTRGLISTVTDWVSGTTELDYDDAGNLVSITRPNQLETRLDYDDVGELSSSEVVDLGENGAPTISSILLTRDLTGRITGVARDLPSSGSPANEESLYTPDAGHQLAGGSYAYDAMGRRIADSNRNYTWDLASMLTAYTASGGLVNSTYDAYGIRTQRTQGSTTRGYVVNYALSFPSICTMTDGSSDLTYYVYLPSGTLLYSIAASNNSRRFYHFDEVGNTIYLSDDSGAITDTYKLTPFGRLISQTGATENPFIYGGLFGVVSEGAGLYYMRARYYDAESARFISKDPVKGLMPSSVNPYQFAFNNPNLYADPSGREVTLGGYGRFGLAYNESPSVRGSEQEHRIEQRFRLTITGTTESDGGVQFEGRIRLREDNDQRHDNSGFGAAGFAVSSGGFRLDVGNVADVLDQGDTVYYYGYDVGLTSFSDYNSNYDGFGSIGGFGTAARSDPTPSKEKYFYLAGLQGLSGLGAGSDVGGPVGGFGSGSPDVSAIKLRYTAGDFTIGVGGSPTQIDPGTYTGAVPTGGSFWGSDSGPTFGVGYESNFSDFSHDLGGGILIRGSIGQSPNSATISDLGLSFRP
ncbi:MAG: DUF6531 domain-containing protein [Verrucomicrobiota bacterium]